MEQFGHGTRDRALVLRMAERIYCARLTSAALVRELDDGADPQALHEGLARQAFAAADEFYQQAAELDLIDDANAAMASEPPRWGRDLARQTPAR